MAEAAAQTELLTIAEFVRLYETEGAFEYINGERFSLMPATFEHSSALNNLVYALNAFALPRRLGKAYAETAFVTLLKPGTNWVKASRVPDVMYITYEHLQAVDVTPGLPLVLVPDLVAEVVSTNDTLIEVDDKIDSYLRDGVRLVWVLNPRQRSVTIHTAGSRQLTVVKGTDLLTGGDILPGFEMSAAQIFSVL